MCDVAIIGGPGREDECAGYIPPKIPREEPDLIQALLYL